MQQRNIRVSVDPRVQWGGKLSRRQRFAVHNDNSVQCLAGDAYGSMLVVGWAAALIRAG